MMHLKRNIALLVLCMLFNSVQAQEAKTLMLKLEVSDSTYKLVDAWVLSRAFPASASLKKAGEGALNWDISSSTGEVLAKGIISDPQVIRAHLSEENTLSLHQSRLEKATVIIRVPYDKNMEKLNIERMPLIHLPPMQEKTAKKSQKLEVNKREFLIIPREVQ